MRDERRGLPSASSMQRLSLCPGSFAAERKCADEAGEYAQSGTAAHRWLAWKLKPRGEEPKLEEFEKRFAAKASQQVEELVFNFLKSSESNPAFWLVEYRIWFSLGIKKLFSAKPDCAVIALPRAFVFDFKSLFGDHPHPAKNHQLRTTLVILKQMFPDITEGYGAIIQPRVGAPEPALYNDADLKAATEETLAIVSAARKPRAPRVGGEIQCAWCKARATCPEAHKLAVMEPEISQLPDEKEQITALIDEMPVDKLAQVWHRWGTVEKIFNAIDSKLENLPAEELAKLGLSVESRRKRTLYQNVNAVYEELAPLGLKPENFYKTLTLGFGALVDQMRELRPELSGQAAEMMLRDKLARLATEVPDRPTLGKLKA